MNDCGFVERDSRASIELNNARTLNALGKIFIRRADDHSFDAAVLRKCTSMQVLPDGRMIPNCGYRVIHRPSDPRWQTHKERNPGHGVDGLRRQLTLIS